MYSVKVRRQGRQRFHARTGLSTPVRVTVTTLNRPPQRVTDPRCGGVLAQREQTPSIKQCRSGSTPCANSCRPSQQCASASIGPMHSIRCQASARAACEGSTRPAVSTMTRQRSRAAVVVRNLRTDDSSARTVWESTCLNGCHTPRDHVSCRRAALLSCRRSMHSKRSRRAMLLLHPCEKLLRANGPRPLRL